VARISMVFMTFRFIASPRTNRSASIAYLSADISLHSRT
jgi:hypothetical protein